MARRRDWIVRVKATVIRDIVVRNATEDEAANDPYECDVVDETEVMCLDVGVLSVEPSE